MTGYRVLEEAFPNIEEDGREVARLLNQKREDRAIIMRGSRDTAHGRAGEAQEGYERIIRLRDYKEEHGEGRGHDRRG